MAWISTDGQLRTEIGENASSYIYMRLSRYESRQVGIKFSLFLVSFIAKTGKKQQHGIWPTVIRGYLVLTDRWTLQHPVLYLMLHALTTTREARLCLLMLQKHKKCMQIDVQWEAYRKKCEKTGKQQVS